MAEFDDAVILRRSILAYLMASFDGVSSTGASTSPRRSMSPECQIDTPASTSRSTTVVNTPDPEHKRGPHFERSIHLYELSDVQINQERVCEELLAIENNIPKSHLLFKLPVTVRRRIYNYCFPNESRRISLSPRWATKAVFTDGHFASPWEVLEPVFGGMHAFQQLRYDLMTYFWTKYHFHVTLSPFTGPKFSPLSQVWLSEYLDIVQYLTVEADLARFGFGTQEFAAAFGHNMYKTENLLIDIVKGLTKRRGKTTMAEFNLLCRRYSDFRTFAASDPTTFETFQYCPDDALYFADAISGLRGILKKARVAGFTLEYTRLLLRLIFADGDHDPSFRQADVCAWPPVPSRTPSEGFGRVNHALFALMNPSSYSLPLTSASTSSFTEDVENELMKYESSTYSERAPAEHESLAEEPRIPTSETIYTIADPCQRYQACVGSMTSLASSISQAYQMVTSDSQQTVTAASVQNLHSPVTGFGKPKFSIEAPRLPLKINDSSRQLVVPAPTNELRCRTPESPNALNRRNEQDPAFVKALHALRSLSFDNSDSSTADRTPRTRSKIPSPVRKKEDGPVRKYLSFMKRFGG